MAARVAVMLPRACRLHLNISVICRISENLVTAVPDLASDRLLHKAIAGQKTRVLCAGATILEVC